MRNKPTLIASSTVGILLLSLMFLCDATVDLGTPPPIPTPKEEVESPVKNETENMEDISMSPPVSEPIYELYFTSPTFPDRPETRPERVEILEGLTNALNRAQSSVDIAIYELGLPQLVETLVTLHERGVEVRIVTDDEELEDWETFEVLEDAGIEIRPDDRSALMHNKFVIIDEAMVWTGSWNFTPNGTYRNNNNGLLIRSPELAQNYMAEFEEMFVDGEFGPRSPENTPRPTVTVDGMTMQTCFAPEDDCADQIAAVLKQAEETIHYMAFSFTSEPIDDALRNRGRAGIQIYGILENRGSGTQYSVYNGHRRRKNYTVERDGNPYTMHHKVFVIDARTVILGSFNFSKNADRSNDENVLIVENPDIAAQYIAEYERLYEVALNPPN